MSGKVAGLVHHYSIKKGKEVAGIKKDGRSIIAAIDGMVDEIIAHEPRQPSHAASLVEVLAPSRNT
jgi:hypothetical protein